MKEFLNQLALPLPKALLNMEPVKALKHTASKEIKELFPYLIDQEVKEKLSSEPLKVGVVLSGGQAAGGHNVIYGLLEGLLQLNEQSQLIGFLNGPSAIVENRFKVLDKAFVSKFFNTGGFDMIGSGRTKIEKPEQFESSLKTVREHKLDALVVIGGDDSNTNAALLAEYFLAHGQKTAVIGVPKTIDGDLKNEAIEVSFGFDTAAKVYSELVGNLLTDALSAKKYWFFVRLMGRSASHLTLEVAKKTHPNLTLISEERRDIKAIVDEIVELILARAKEGKNYGMILVPEGLIEFLPEIPKDFFEGMELSYDSHGNLEVSKIETEALLIELVRRELEGRAPFSSQALFFGYEGRSAYPSFFDAAYTYALGRTAALLASQGATGQIATVGNLTEPVEAWIPRGSSLLPMMALEERKGVLKPVIKKALVEVDSKDYKQFKKESADWRLKDDYISPGPIQFWGPDEVVKSRPFILNDRGS